MLNGLVRLDKSGNLENFKIITDSITNSAEDTNMLADIGQAHG
jgi:hypothetical protein